MNFTEVQKSVGDSFRLRPIPARVRPDGSSLPLSDDKWLLEAVTSEPRGVHLINKATGHSVHLQMDNLREFHNPDVLVLRCVLTIKGDQIAIEPSLRPTSPIPISRYRLAKEKSFEQWVPVDSHICDGCTATVQYRPMIQIALPADAEMPATTERFCAPCARERGVNTVMSGATVPGWPYGRTNPTFVEYLRCIIKPVVADLARNPDIKSRVSKVAALVSPSHVTFQVMRAGETMEVPVPIETMESDRNRSQASLGELAVTAIRKALEHT